ncbi:MAG TPA: hypothetical protein EYG34_07840 [Acidimicrobiia bacterium]|jgi:uncharacterized membrane protein YczE|nr:hypothetical protein [Actinomycetota bacterium]HIG24955.1 hypothetical protein [Acidimicrobiia bacterium]MBT3746871.1 hypothetical protein [Actinomycetota bacterium]MBT3970204.1 hypothetical protein [Actinomycetota bacterium]MBT4010127.1 hypothetical protein [Actinomycetota bacterium]
MEKRLPRPNGPLAGRLLSMLAGLVLFGAGISLLFLADFGVGPWDVFHDGLANQIDRSVGTVIIGVGVLMLVLLVAFRQPLGIATLANVVIIGVVVDATMDAFAMPSTMWVRLLLMFGSPVMVGLASMLYLGAGLGVGPRDGMMTALMDSGRSARLARTSIELGILVLGILLGGSYGVGTVVFALGVGPSYQFFSHRVWPGWVELTGFGVYRR